MRLCSDKWGLTRGERSLRDLPTKLLCCSLTFAPPFCLIIWNREMKTRPKYFSDVSKTTNIGSSDSRPWWQWELQGSHQLQNCTSHSVIEQGTLIVCVCWLDCSLHWLLPQAYRENYCLNCNKARMSYSCKRLSIPWRTFRHVDVTDDFHDDEIEKCD